MEVKARMVYSLHTPGASSNSANIFWNAIGNAGVTVECRMPKPEEPEHGQVLKRV